MSTTSPQPAARTAWWKGLGPSASRLIQTLHRTWVEQAGQPALAEGLAGTGPEKYLNPEVLARIGLSPLSARLVVEGFLNGLHKSPFHGFSVEFADHREYVAGDDLKYLDW